jgi:molybdenum cofactor biosynthesis protein B
VVTISDTRTLANDQGGLLIVHMLEEAGHQVAARRIVRDEPPAIQAQVAELTARDDLDVLLMTGGTGIGSRDQTCETVSGLLDKQLPGYGELFRMLSFREIGAAAMLSRAMAGVAGRKVVMTMPGSPAAVRLAMENLILPELAHLVREARR